MCGVVQRLNEKIYKASCLDPVVYSLFIEVVNLRTGDRSIVAENAVDPHVLEVSCRIGIGEHQNRARPLACDFSIEGEAAILNVASGSRERGATAFDPAVEPSVEPLTRDHHVAHDDG